jgi:versiconal hemiacetal acetate esterase
MVPCTTHWDNVPSKYADKYKSYEENKEGSAVIDKKSMEIFYEHVGADPKDPGTFTILATDKHSEFPPVYMTSCEFDPLRDDATIMELALKEAGVPVKHDYYQSFPHYFWIFPPVPEGQEYVGKLIAGIEWLKGQM